MARMTDDSLFVNGDYVVGTDIVNSGTFTLNDSIGNSLYERIDELEKTVKILTQYIIELNKQLEHENNPDIFDDPDDDLDLPF